MVEENIGNGDVAVGHQAIDHEAVRGGMVGVTVHDMEVVESGAIQGQDKSYRCNRIVSIEVVGADPVEFGVIAEDHDEVAIAADAEVFKDKLVDTVAVIDPVCTPDVFFGDEVGVIVEVEEGVGPLPMDLDIVGGDGEVLVEAEVGGGQPELGAVGDGFEGSDEVGGGGRP